MGYQTSISGQKIKVIKMQKICPTRDVGEK